MHSNWQCTENNPKDTTSLDIRYRALADIERDLLVIERVDTTVNTADHLTKLLSRTLFYRHNDYIMGHVAPPQLPLFCRYTQQAPAAAVTKLICLEDCLLSPWELCVFVNKLF